MSDNLLINPSFEQGIGGHKALVITPDPAAAQYSYFTERGEVNTPEGWGVWYVHDNRAPQHDPGNADGWCEPEVRLAPHEGRQVDGANGAVLFTFYRIHDGGLYQQVKVTMGKHYLFEAKAHAWTGNSDDPKVSEGVWRDEFFALVGTTGHMQASFWLGIDPTGGLDPLAESVVWGEGAHIYNAFASVPAAEAVAQSDTVTVFTRGRFRWPFKHNDQYWDAMHLVQVGDAVQPSPVDPDGYRATAMVVDFDIITDPARRKALYALAEQRGIMVGPSHDHIRAWPPGAASYTVELWDIPADKRDGLVAYYAQSPAIVVTFEGAGDGGSGGSVTPPVTPTPTPTEPQYTLRSNNLIGLHSGFVRARTWDYIEQSGTTLAKFFSCGDAYEAAMRAPEMPTVWRKFVGNEEGRIHEKPTIRESARWYLDQYSAELATVAGNTGLSVEQLLLGIDAIESLNETVGTHNEAGTRAAVEFDVCFAEELHARYGDLVRPVLLNVAIGNPDIDEVEWLLPAARAAVKYRGYLGYHMYWTANETRSFLVDKWQWHAGRNLDGWDPVFRAHGVYPRYASGEGGIVYAHDGDSFNSGLGWKACGSIDRYLADIATFNALGLRWNREHGNRFNGLTLFGYGNWSWDSFELGDGEVLLLIQWSKTPDESYSVSASAQLVSLSARSEAQEHDAYIAALESYLSERADMLDGANRHALETLLARERVK